MWWLGHSPTHHIYGSLLRARGFFITLLVWGVLSRRRFVLGPWSVGAIPERRETSSRLPPDCFVAKLWEPRATPHTTRLLSGA